MNRLARVCIFLLAFCPAILLAQVAPAPESGKFRLHKFEQAIGEESYSITPDGNALTLKSDFKFTDRGTPVPLMATLRTSNSYVPQSYVIKGNTSRLSTIDTDVTITGANATIRQGKDTRTAAVPQTFFTISGYAPVSVQMEMMRYWKTHGSPAQMNTLPIGAVRIQDRGSQTMQIGGRDVKVERYTVQGLIWGMEVLWMDSNSNLAALVSTDAEFDHFEAIRDEYESALSDFVASAAHDGMAALTEMSQKLPGRRTGTFAFVGATVIDGAGQAPIPNATVVTSNGKIVAVGSSANVRIPSDAQRIDVSGKYIIPGLWDMHAHYEQVEWGPIYLAAGVTTVRDVGNEYDFITQVRDAVNSGKALGPHMLLAGIVDGDGPYAIGITRVNNAEDAQKWVTKYHDSGFQQIKIYSSVKSDNVKAICADAHKVGMTVTGHIPIGMNAYEGVDDGMDMINHIHYISDLLLPKDYDPKKVKGLERLKVLSSVDVNSDAGKQAVAFLKQHGTVIDPTMALMEMTLRLANEPATQMDPGISRVAPELREQLVNGGVPPEAAPYAQKIEQNDLALIGALHRAGVPIIAGTDQAVPGFSVYREIELYVQAGFTPMEALQAATIVPARAMKAEGDSGSLEPGKRADLDVLDANPLEDIHNVRTVRSVLANGVLYDPAPLWESVGFSAH
ncbi:MAG TPA: amidohydrolase family protein [Terriglobales bacterium]|nr:amidohydrolase family protein [Terriglobales bacterium]